MLNIKKHCVLNNSEIWEAKFKSVFEIGRTFLLFLYCNFSFLFHFAQLINSLLTVRPLFIISFSPTRYFSLFLLLLLINFSVLSFFFLFLFVLFLVLVRFFFISLHLYFSPDFSLLFLLFLFVTFFPVFSIFPSFNFFI